MENHKTPPSLHELQLWMKWIITDPRGVKDALTNPFPTTRPYLERYTSPTKNVLPWILDNTATDASDRLEIYAEAYFIRLFESMKADFPITYRVLGGPSFQKLVSDYLKKFPSQTTNIGELGRFFSNFIATYDDLNEAAFLVHLTEMEWLMIESFYAKNTAFLNHSVLKHLSEEDWASAEFMVAPSVYLIESNWRLDQFSKWRDDSTEINSEYFESMPEKKGYLIFRENGHVRIEEQFSASFYVLQKLKSGKNLLSALEASQEKFSEIDIGPQIMTWFNIWVERAIIYDLKPKNKKVTL